MALSITGRIRQGYRPHPRHWKALAELVNVSPDGVVQVGGSAVLSPSECKTQPIIF
jgi:hypothetical protein